MDRLRKSVVEQASFVWLRAMNYTIFSGLENVLGEVAAELEGYKQVILKSRLCQAFPKPISRHVWASRPGHI